MLTFLIFLLVLSVLVLIHEAGHYFAARMFGVKAEEFGYGFPPRAIGWTWLNGKWKKVGRKDDKAYPNTIWSVNWLPLGGFVRIKGETIDGVDDKDSMHTKPIWQRVVIIAAGVIMNWILAIVLVTIVFSSGTLTILEDLPQGARVSNQQVLVTSVLDQSPAKEVGLEAGDILVSVNGTKLDSADRARDAIKAIGTEPVHLVIKRDKQEQQIHATPRFLEETQTTAVGVSLADAGIVSLSIPQAFIQATRHVAMLTVAIVAALGGLVRDLVVTQNVSSDVSGPVGIAVMTGQVAKQGIMALLYFAAILSVNLAVVNFLPIPALDGGRVLFLIIEKIRRRPMNRELEIKIHNTAFLILIALILLVTVRDVFHYGGALVAGAKGLVGM